MKLKPFKDIYIVVKLNYIGRLIIIPVEFLLSCAVFYHHKEPLHYYLTWLAIYLLWPTAAFLHAANSKDQKKAEGRNIFIEAVIAGGFLAILKLDLWASLAFYAINLLFYTMILGPSHFLKALFAITSSAIVTTLLIPSYTRMPDSSPLTIVFSFALILVSIAFMGISSFNTNSRLSKHRKDLKEKQDQMVSSLRYARTIQNSLMAVPESIHKKLPNSFIIWEPRDIVGGDIYFTHFSENEFVISVIDCTGHGVPGALLSMVASSVLQRIVRAEKINKPSEILHRLNLIVKLTLYQNTLYTFSDDGMDVGVCVVDKSTRKLTYAGARIPLLVIKNGKSEIYKGDKASIGYRFSDTEFQYKDHEMVMENNSAFYLFSDGITTQTGGKEDMMFGTKRLRTLLEDLHGRPFRQQKETVMDAINQYQKEMNRKDDITLVGFSLDDPIRSDYI